VNRAAMLANPRFRTGDYTVTRTAEPTWTAGVKVAGATTTFTTGDASLQPASQATLKVLPEGTHAAGAADLWTTTALRAQPVADVVTIDSESWRVVRVEKHVGMGGTHYIVGLARSKTP
jgi:hypothetical protein